MRNILLIITMLFTTVVVGQNGEATYAEREKMSLFINAKMPFYKTSFIDDSDYYKIELNKDFIDNHKLAGGQFIIEFREGKTNNIKLVLITKKDLENIILFENTMILEIIKNNLEENVEDLYNFIMRQYKQDKSCRVYIRVGKNYFEYFKNDSYYNIFFTAPFLEEVVTYED